MRLAIALTFAGLLAATLPAADKADGPKPPKGFTALFNGKDLDGWQGNIDMGQRAKLSPEKQTELVKARTTLAKEQWTVEGDVLRHTPPKDRGKGVSLQTVKDYGNFELYLDWKIEKNGDSGLYLRGQPQVQIWDSENAGGAQGVDKNSGSGGLWNNPLPKGVDPKSIGKVPLKKADKPVGQWNTFHIIMNGEKVTVHLNGELVVDNQTLAAFKSFNDKLPEKGPIELQFHGDPLWFKNIYLKELP